MKNIIDVVAYAANIRCVQDGDAGGELQFTEMMQGVGNRTAYLKGQTDALNGHVGGGVELTWAMAAVADNAVATLSIVAQVTAADGSFSVASNLISVPSTGVYLVTGSGALAATDTTNPLDVGVRVQRATVDQFAGIRRRYSGTAAEVVQVQFQGVVIITNITTQKIGLVANVAAGTLTTSGTLNKISVAKLA